MARPRDTSPTASTRSGSPRRVARSTRSSRSLARAARATTGEARWSAWCSLPSSCLNRRASSPRTIPISHARSACNATPGRAVARCAGAWVSTATTAARVARPATCRTRSRDSRNRPIAPRSTPSRVIHAGTRWCAHRTSRRARAVTTATPRSGSTSAGSRSSRPARRGGRRSQARLPGCSTGASICATTPSVLRTCTTSAAWSASTATRSTT
jgi:hypothetical protein